MVKHHDVCTKKTPFYITAIDIYGPIKTKHFNIKREELYFYIIVFIGIESRFITVEYMFKIDALKISKITKVYIMKHPETKKIVTDQDRNF